MTVGQILNTYFKKKIIIYLSVFTIILLYLYCKNRSINWESAMIVGSLFIVSILFFGLSDYCFYEKRLGNIINELLNESPLKEFIAKGFVPDDGKLTGCIDDFTIVLSPSANTSGDKYLTILLPIEPQDGLEKYFAKFDDLFKITFTGKVLFASATIKNYKKNYNFDKLFTFIQNTIFLLKDRNIQPLEIDND